LPPSRPVAAFVLGLIGGIFILIGGVLSLLFSTFFFNFLGILGIVFGIVVVVGSIMLVSFPSQHVAWGIVVLIFSVTSIVSFAGGFVVGLVLGILGGAMGLAWNPATGSYGSEPQPAGFAGPYGLPMAPWRMCMGCGRWIPWAYNQCPMCGTATPVAPWVPRAWVPGSTPPTVAVAPNPWGPPVAAVAPNPWAPPVAGAAPNPWAPPSASGPPPPQPETPKAPCPTCEREAEWLPTYKRWYCRAEGRYF